MNADPYVHRPKHAPTKQRNWITCPQRDADIRKLCRADGGKYLFYATPYIALYFLAVYAQFLIDNVWANIAIAALIANQIYVLFILHHDCMHGSAFKNDAFNRLTGRLCALVFTMTFTVNRETHRRHHTYFADPERDPDEYYFAGKLSQIWLRIWRYWEWYTRIALNRYGTKVRRLVLVEQTVNFGLWVVIHVVLSHYGLGMKTLYIFVLPLVILNCVINPIARGYEHSTVTLHEDMSDKVDMTKNTITVDNPWLGLLWANITYHVEHHAFPKCPFYNLKKLHKILQEEGVEYLTAPYPLYGVSRGQGLMEALANRRSGYEKEAAPCKSSA
jgi:beta-carotene hydroxylase